MINELEHAKWLPIRHASVHKFNMSVDEDIYVCTELFATATPFIYLLFCFLGKHVIFALDWILGQYTKSKKVVTKA